MRSKELVSRVTCSIRMRFVPAELKRVLELLRAVVGQTRALAGCRVCELDRDTTEEDRLCYREEWDSEPAFRRHVKSASFRRVLVAMDMSSEEPQVVVGTLSGRSGIGCLQELCEDAGGVAE